MNQNAPNSLQHMLCLFKTLNSPDSFTKQTYAYATPILCDNNHRNIIELDQDADDQDFYIFHPEPIKRKPPLMFTPNQIKTNNKPKQSYSSR